MTTHRSYAGTALPVCNHVNSHRGIRRTAQPRCGVGQQGKQQDFKLASHEAKRFSVAPGQLGNVVTAAFPMLMRWGSGAFAMGYRSNLFAKDDGKYGVVKYAGRKVSEASAVGSFKRPAKPIELYDLQSCPFCTRVREAVNMLDLDVMLYPCPSGGPTFRPKAKQLGAKSYPFMRDPNTGTQLNESADIIKYLFEQYGSREGQTKPPWGLLLGPLTAISCTLANLPRGLKGSRYVKAKQPQQPLILWAYHASPFSRIAQEAMAELELPYLFRTVARGSPKRQLMVDEQGQFLSPFLQDPNTGTAMWESSEIVKYLHRTYAENTS